MYRAIKQGEGRITPACAGKTCPKCVFRAIMGDHPRMRGEDLCGYYVAVHCGGSPPHARGRLKHFIGRDPAFGITPACAGKTCISVVDLSILADHPRMRGEDAGKFNGKDVFIGITPACAGKTVARA